MANRPSEFLDWIPDNTTNIVDPPIELKNSGWEPGESPPARYFNWIINLTNQWLEYLDEITGGWPNSFADDEISLGVALAQAVADGGGVIAIREAFTIQSSTTIPPNTLLLGREGATVMTVGATAQLILSDNSKLEYLEMDTERISGNVVEMQGYAGLIRNCKQTLDPDLPLVGISVQGDACGVERVLFNGAGAGTTSVGIAFEAGYAESYEENCTYIP